MSSYKNRDTLSGWIGILWPLAIFAVACLLIYRFLAWLICSPLP